MNRLLCFVGPYDSYQKGSEISIDYPPNCELVMYCEKKNIRVRARYLLWNTHLTVLCTSKKYFGIKGKPWSAQPIEISKFLNKNVGKHEIKLIAKNSPPKTYVVDFQMVRNVPIPSIVKEIEETRFVSKSTILREGMSQITSSLYNFLFTRLNFPLYIALLAETEEDIVQTVERVPLSDPTTFQRITVPCKDPGCSHAQCFDCATFLELNKSIPTWTCPICNRRIDPKSIYVDGLFMEILALTSTSVSIVELHRNGDWTVPKHIKEDDNVNDKQRSVEGYLDDIEKSNYLLLDQIAAPPRKKVKESKVVFVDLTISDGEPVQLDQSPVEEASISQYNLESGRAANASGTGAQVLSEHSTNLVFNNPSVLETALSLNVDLPPLPFGWNDHIQSNPRNVPDSVADQSYTDLAAHESHPPSDGVQSHIDPTPAPSEPSVYGSLKKLVQWDTPNEERYSPRVLPVPFDGYWGSI